MTQHDGAQNGDFARPKHTHDDANAGGTTAATPSKRKLVLFADGTGNAFTAQESSVWRLYEALDHTQPDQIAHYIKGVGTAGWAPLAALDGATGIGVPSNVRKLYRFLCWNWREGDEIYIFGFSRGAFTARTLAALIASQGLVPAEIEGRAGLACRDGAQRHVRMAGIPQGIGGLSKPADDLDCALDSRRAALSSIISSAGTAPIARSARPWPAARTSRSNSSGCSTRSRLSAYRSRSCASRSTGQFGRFRSAITGPRARRSTSVTRSRSTTSAPPFIRCGSTRAV